MNDNLLERIERLNAIGIALSAERDTSRLLEQIVQNAKELTGADGGTLYSVTETGLVKFEIVSTDSLGLAMGGSTGLDVPFAPLSLYVDGQPNNSMLVTSCVLNQQTINISDAYDAAGYDFSGTKRFDAQTGYRTQSVLTVPMKNHDNDIIGVLQLINACEDGNVVAFTDESLHITESLASQAAVALTNQRLLNESKLLFEAFIRMIAEAIDEKSPYTGDHCRRVPELTMLLADAAHATTHGPLADFALSEQDRYALHIAGWLHDCGKVITPEHVMDKATKLETIYDRMNAVELRFEVLFRDAEIAYLRRLQAADGVSGELEQVYAQQLAELHSERVFLQRVNIGSESMSTADQERVRLIANRRWRDIATGTEQPLLSADEVENLCIRRGTLNDRERAIINNHIVATIRMLEALPFPKHLRAVPEYAGGHHERMDGKGYPKGLRREQMSIPARVMAIADIFEALTARDRPYKPGKKLSECLQIMGRMKLDQHIDPDLFDVFVNEKIYLKYAERFLDREQIDVIEPADIPGYQPVANLS